MTKYFFLLCIGFFIAVTFIPIRIIICVYLVYKFYRGQFYHKRRIRSNMEIITIEFMHFLEENKLRHLFANMEDPWDKILQRKISLTQLEAKLTQYFQEVLKLYFPKDFLKLKDPDTKEPLADTP